VAFKNIGKQRDILIEHLERVGTRETAGLQRFLEVLGTIAGVSTLLGLLGTISGMIKIFSVISQQSTVNPTALAAGISEALITTFARLVVAIPVIVMHRYLQTKADAYAEEMEEHSVDLMELLTEKAVQH
jgi:biopolymer transport protein ExbB